MVLNAVYVAIVFMGWGLSAFLMGWVGRELPFQNALFCNLVGAFTVNLYFVAQGLHWTYSPLYLGAIASGALFTIADLAYYKLSKTGMPVSTLGPLTSLYILVPIVLGATLLREPLSARKLFGIFLACVALYFLSGEHEEKLGTSLSDEKESV